MEYVLSVLLFTLLGAAYVLGYDFVKKRSADYLPHFCLGMAVVRLLLASTLAGIIIFFKEDREDAITFAIIYMVMYLLTMVVTLKLRH
jgi:hypothetical protein